jgi:antitoxin component YwqK of YwqJK toxin-antitoxin module
MYYLTGNPYSGWSCSILSNNIHRYRYEQYENGVMIRRIGYYDNGNIDADFRMKNCKNYGPSRMWRYESGMYIDEFYSEPGVPNGIHRRWHDNGMLAREALYENGILLTEKEFDRNGKLITKK